MIVFFSQSLKREVNQRIDVIPRIIYEPQLINDDSRYILQPGSELPAHYFRLKAVDDVKLLGTCLNNFIMQYIDENRKPPSIFIWDFRDYKCFNLRLCYSPYPNVFSVTQYLPVIFSGINILLCYILNFAM